MCQRILILASAVLMATAGSVARVAAQPHEFEVKQDRLFGGIRGALIFTQETVEYRTPKKKDAREWSYLAIQQFRILSPTKIALATYEDRGHMRPGADRVYEFDVTRGEIGPDLVEFLLARVDRPIVSAVMPRLPSEARFRVPVKHQRHRRGSEGTLLLFEHGLAYATEREAQARYWRFRDLFAVLPLDRYRLEVRAYEGGSGETRPFVFELKTEIVPEMYEALWREVNRRSLATTGSEASGPSAISPVKR